MEYPEGLTLEQKKSLDEQEFGGNGVKQSTLKMYGIKKPDVSRETIEEVAEKIEEEVSKPEPESVKKAKKKWKGKK